ncbi:GDSL-type esterase/lipase family protein [Enterococcus timonensis]|uniref:GDSL-type esterase/lipase family protein n=1 Tax=Enterococcus timonensis TaxID=1852364 RepID=UPI0008D95753|nr:GDSL-type esterase/lipase family protein [Enterococcus timonensis]
MKKVVLFGDSLTAGFDGQTTSDVLTQEVAQDLENMGFPMTVKNFGHRGDTTFDALKRLPEVLAENPDYVTVFFGNDLLHNEVTKEEYIKNIQSLTEKIGPDKVILITPAYVDPKLHHEDRRGQDIHSYGKALVDYAKENNLSHLDLAYHMTVYPKADEFLLADGLHLSKWGNELLGNLIARNIKILELKKLEV